MNDTHTITSLASARACIAAIAADDPVALEKAWSLEMPQRMAQKLVIQAWRKDKNNKRQAITKANGGLVSAIYIAVSNGAELPLEGGATLDNASMLLVSASMEVDDPELLAVVLLWDEEFSIAGCDRVNNTVYTAPVGEICAMMTSNRATKCAELWQEWHVGRAAKRPEGASNGSSVHKLTPPVALAGLVGRARLCIVHNHPGVRRAATFEPDATKMVMLADFQLPYVPSTTSGKTEAAGRRQKATKIMEGRGHVLLESCNMRAAFYDHGGSNATFYADAEAAATASGLKIGIAKRVIDPGMGLVSLETGEEKFFLL